MVLPIATTIPTFRHLKERIYLMLGGLDRVYIFACFLLATFAFLFNWATGHRGVFLLDQSMVFDGGWRVLQGQTPYRDFLMPFAPVTFWIQAFFFRLLGVTWTATVLPACMVNAIATLSVIRIIRLLGGGSRLLALCGGLATAICFQAPFGTLWLEQTAMFFDLLALQAAVESLCASGYRRGFWQLGSGFSLALAALSKQNYGLFFFPIPFAVLAAGELPDVRRACRSVLIAGAGMVAMFTVFLGWVWAFSDFSSFVQCTIVVAGQIGRSRMTPQTIITALTFGAVPNACQVDLIGVFAGIIALLLACSNLRAKDSKRTVWRETAPACAVTILVPFFHSITQTTTENDWQNSLAFVGLTGCLGVGLLFRIMDYISVVPCANPDVMLRLPSARFVKICLLLVAGIWGLETLAYESRAAWQRNVQQFAKDTHFLDTVRVRGMERVRWGEPTSIDKTTTLHKADFEGLVSYLSADGAPFFVMGDSTILYGLLGTRSPQPLLYFLQSHSFLKKEIPRLDEIISESLERNKVRIVIREKVTFLTGVHDSYAQFPRTWGWFTSHFDHLSDYGNYEIWKRRPEAQR